MHSLRHILGVTLVAGCFLLLGASGAHAADAPHKTAVPSTPDPAVVEFLLASATKDFKAAGPGGPVAIRNARVGYLHDSNSGHYLLCGNFQSGDAKDAKWTPFATIKTSDYEQWIGGAAGSFCGQKNIKWYPGNHSSALLQRVRN
jgi:hypothetical protein